MAYPKLGRNVRRLICMLILLTVVVHTIIVLNVKTKVGTQKKKKLVRDHEEALCNFRLNRSSVSRSPIRGECPEGGIVTVFYGGGLEAQMWAYASVLAVGRITSLSPFVPICMHSFLSKVFDDLTVPPLSSISECDIPLPEAAKSLPDWPGENRSLVLPVFSYLTDTVLENLDAVINEFRLNGNLLNHGSRILRDLARGRTENPVFVGVPLPGYWESVGDGLNYPDANYYEKVFKHVREKKGNDTVFVVVSDEEIRRTSFAGDDVFFVTTGVSRLGLDLALLSLCNMSVLGFEGIGVWGALLSKGEAFLFETYDDKYGSYVRALMQFHIFE